ncbi:Thioredoxin domain-containing protein 15 [Orchesella cincta]|uniref:Thioredoxin domain-containing protein 15 n=1 Tax=Orchesella cincta TaxID=48709 RepID=A0A1D2NCX3_ORCCI|nr:Thioredoxin domain-containing protein 15 [Orchesella cincta]
MRFKRCSVNYLGVLIIAVFIVSGNADVETDNSANEADGVEEVSIEAVDDDEPQKPLASYQSHHSVKSNFESIVFPASNQTSTDNSTAVATVYPSGDVNSANGNLTAAGNGTDGTNGTSSRYLRVKVACSELFPENSTHIGTVEIVNMTHLLHGILISNPAIKTRSTPSNCTVVFFYTYWCPWSAKAAPHFNALPRAFRNIRFAAVDSYVYPAINTYFGVLSVPTVVLFYNGKTLAKFNDTTFTVNQFAEFISTFTDQKPGIRLNVTSADFQGPIPSAIIKGHDWYLYLSWAFILACFIYYISKTTLWQRVLELVQNSWREAEAVSSVPTPPQHFHQD